MPNHPLHGMYNKRGGKVRLTFKLEVDQLWLGTKGRYSKIAKLKVTQLSNKVFTLPAENMHLLDDYVMYFYCLDARVT